MQRFIKSEVGAAVVWVIGSVLLAAAITPWVYQAAQSFAALAAAKELPGVLEWLGEVCGRTKFSRFFDRCLLVSVLLLLPLLLRRIRMVRSRAEPAGEECSEHRSWQSCCARIALGALISGGLLFLLGVLLTSAGVYVARDPSPALRVMMGQVIVPAVVVSLIEECLFRGLLLGLWLRFSRPLAACVGTSIVFACVHFLKPPKGVLIEHPTDALAGFDLLGKILRHFSDPVFFVTDFASLFTAGLILAWARVRTGALWFSIGLHAGWIIAFKGFNLMHRGVSEHPLRPWGVGENLRSGLLPLLTLGITAVLCHFALGWLEKRRTAC